MIILEETGGTVVLGFIRLLECEVPASHEEWEEIQELLYRHAREYNEITNEVYFPNFPPPPPAPLSRFTGF